MTTAFSSVTRRFSRPAAIVQRLHLNPGLFGGEPFAQPRRCPVRPGPLAVRSLNTRVVGGRFEGVSIIGSTGYGGGFDRHVQPLSSFGEGLINADLLGDREGLPDALILEALGGHFIAAGAVKPAQVELGRCIEPEEFRAPHMDAT